MYDLDLTPVTEPNNPHWPPAHYNKQSRAGPAHGLHANIPEGYGRGRCTIVLVGGRSGGHDAAVLGAVSIYLRFNTDSALKWLLGIPSKIRSHCHLWGEYQSFNKQDPD